MEKVSKHVDKFVISIYSRQERNHSCLAQKEQQLPFTEQRSELPALHYLLYTPINSARVASTPT